MSGFPEALPFTLRWEGGYVDHPADPGGATNRGVTQATYDAWRKAGGLATRSVRLIEDDEVGAIYRDRYWSEAGCDALPWPMSLAHFDAAVNHGPRNAVRILQRALGVKVDGKIGPVTVAAARSAGPLMVRLMLCERRSFYHEIVVQRPTLRVFLDGWLNRLSALRSEVAP